ncbi:MAG: SipW-dependent-type signal peptide-containing protein [Candidatus Paceibacterota bacterium]
MKKIYLSLGIIAIVAIGAVGATRSFFSDTETSTGNTFTAGAIDLKIDSTQHYNGNVCVWDANLINPAGGPNGAWVWSGPEDSYPVPGTYCSGSWELKDLVLTSDKFFNFSDIKPGDKGENTISLHVLNNDAYVCAAVSGLTDFENDQTEPEASVDGTTGTNDGELSSTMLWKVWRDDASTGSAIPGDNIYQDGETILTEGNPENGMLSVYDSTTSTGPLLATGTGFLGVEWTLPSTSGNETQTDSMTGDISFQVVQSRNNTEFKCSDLILQ